MKRLKEYCEKHDYSIAEVVRQAISRFLDEEEKK